MVLAYARRKIVIVFASAFVAGAVLKCHYTTKMSRCGLALPELLELRVLLVREFRASHVARIRPHLFLICLGIGVCHLRMVWNMPPDAVDCRLAFRWAMK
jgi:hypothetical protein